MNCLKSNIIKLLCVFLILSAVGCRKKTSKPNPNEVRATQEKMAEVNKLLLQKDEQRIKGFIKRNGWDMQMTETGLWYKIDKNIDGQAIQTDQIVLLSYELSLLDGTLCYSSELNGIKEFLVGKGGVETGLEEAVLLLSKGDEATFIMPPHLAHGLPGDGDKIPKRAIIVYRIKVIDVKNNIKL